MAPSSSRRTFMAGLAGTACTGLWLGGCTAERPAMGPARPAAAALQPGVQFYMLGEEAYRDSAATFARLGAMGYREVELPRPPASGIDEFVAQARAADIRITSLHLNSGRMAPKNGLSLDSEARLIAETMGRLGAKRAVLPLMPIPESARFGGGRPFGMALQEALAAEGADYWKRLADLLNRRAQDLSAYGISLGYHNHNPEFAPLGDGTGFDLLLQNTDRALVQFELDVGWVASAGLDPVAMLRRLAGRVDQLHLKDVKRGASANFALETQPTLIGTGMVDWPALLKAAREAGVVHGYIEQEPPFDIPRIEVAERSIAYLKTVL